MTIKREQFYSPDEVFDKVTKKVEELNNAGEKIDYISFVPDGEPTLDLNLGKTISALKKLELRIAVITNASLLWMPAVREELNYADWVSVKVDTVYHDLWHRINRPHGKLTLKKILTGIKEFSMSFNGTLVTETMLVGNVNDGLESLNRTAEFIRSLNPEKSFILVPTRPPAEKYVSVPNEYSLNKAYQIFSNYLNNIEFLIADEGIDFTSLGKVETEILSITSVHPMREEAVKKFVQKVNADWKIIENLIEAKKLKKVVYNGANYFVKNLTIKN
jgi:wyosine [tRNA(Phe)-imidazoG37] synthetase (radical SAM superfamily)